ncbi:MAG TPA: tripartite tricarboxylate transporter substrate binding protein [Xanthobacteraceae bacterium]|jgi:tripartite-type tricarboxylate transporter receptor subunit TctC|nr:tripartite tricarboxylate transporter substrate binding protein [Xanthobacteraceae bacterium]
MTRLASLLLAALIGCATTAPLHAEDAWPTKPVRLIVPFPAGSATDIVARIVAEKLGGRLGQQVVIDNRSGASGNIGSEAIARSEPDGYTIGLATNSTHAVAASLNRRLAYDPVKDFAPVSMIGSSPYVLAVHPGLPAKTVSELIALAKQKPGKLSYGSAGPASLAHLAGALFSTLAGVELNHVPYRSSNQAVIDVIEGRIDMQFGTLAPTLPHIRAGKLRALATTGTKRIGLLPDVPTLDEAGLRGYEASLWMAIVAPAAVPPAIVERLNKELRVALTDRDVVAALAVQGLTPEPSTPDELRARIRNEIAKWRDVISKAGITVQ